MADDLHQLAKEYVGVLHSQANAWGQHTHPRFGISHSMLGYMRKTFGVTETDKAVDEALKLWR